MTRLVVDASVALSWIFSDEANSYSESVLRSLKGQVIIVPAHWMLEITNSLVSAERKARITPGATTRALILIAGLPIIIDPKTTDQAGSQTLSLAREHRLTTYDAAYLELSLREGIPLATLDGELITACKNAGGSLL